MEFTGPSRSFRIVFSADISKITGLARKKTGAEAPVEMVITEAVSLRLSFCWPLPIPAALRAEPDRSG